VRPGVDADFVAGHVLFNQNSWSFNHARADDEEGSLDILLIEVGEQFSANVRVKQLRYGISRVTHPV